MFLSVCLTAYLLALVVVFLFSLVQLQLLYYFIKYQLQPKPTMPILSNICAADALPMVTVQLPIYNELYVVERLICAVARLDYPLAKLEIQILDDSTDETSALIQTVLASLPMEWQGVMLHIQRPDRVGFKAGALAYGLAQAKGEFIAIFDADFVPSVDFLQKTVPYLYESPRVGLVQTRWTHLNENFSLLTKIQAFMLDAHFSIEQSGRNVSGHFINFNGTAGVWRRACIDDAGGWQADTLTEDLDLSYRAQVRGWHFRYVPQIATPAELPVLFSAVRSQQFRWTKGAAECARKNWGLIWQTAHLSASVRLHALSHLLNSSVFVAVWVLTVASVGIALALPSNPNASLILGWGRWLSGALYIVIAFFATAFGWAQGISITSAFRFVGLFPAFLAASYGIAFHNMIAVCEGFLGVKTPFVRTPKFNTNTQSNKYIVPKLSAWSVAELMLCGWFLVGLYADWQHGYAALGAMHALAALGYGWVVAMDWRERCAFQ